MTRIEKEANRAHKRINSFAGLLAAAALGGFADNVRSGILAAGGGQAAHPHSGNPRAVKERFHMAGRKHFCPCGSGATYGTCCSARTSRQKGLNNPPNLNPS